MQWFGSFLLWFKPSGSSLPFLKRSWKILQNSVFVHVSLGRDPWPDGKNTLVQACVLCVYVILLIQSQLRPQLYDTFRQNGSMKTVISLHGDSRPKYCSRQYLGLWIAKRELADRMFSVSDISRLGASR